MEFIKKIAKTIVLSSLNVVIATGICAAAFFKLCGEDWKLHLLVLVQLMSVCWLIYILDRLLDVIKRPEDTLTERHKFHLTHQYNLQILCVALVVLNAFLLFYQPKELLIYGGVLSGIVILYLTIVVSQFPKLKDAIMPLLYTAAVAGIPFLLSKSIFMSSWVVGLMFFIVVIQNLHAFSYFESKTFAENSKKRKVVTLLGAINVFLFIIFFWGSFEFANKLALIFTIISVIYSYIVSNTHRFDKKYRWVMDALLLLPLVIL